MGLFTVLPLIFTVSAAFAARIPLCMLPGQTGYPSQSTENCLCSLDSSTIVDTLDPDNMGVERLVIYIYRKLETGEVIAFVPHRELQHQIPDFPEEYGTVNEVNGQPITEIFDLSPSREIRKKISPTDSVYGPHREKQQPVVMVVDKRLDLHGRPQHHPYKNVKYPSWLIPLHNPHQGPRNNYPRPVDFSHDNINHHRPKHSNSDDHPVYVMPKYPNDETNSPKDVSENEYPSYSYHSPAHPYSDGDEPQDSEEHYLEHPASDEHGSNGDITEPSEPSNPQIHVVPLNPNTYPYYNPADNERDTTSPNTAPNVKIIKMPLKDNNGRIIGWKTTKTYHEEKTHHNLVEPYHIAFPAHDNDGHHRIPFWPGNHHNLVKHQAIKVSPFHKDKHHSGDEYGYHGNVPSFNYWLEHQLNISKTNKNKLPTDMIALHTAIRNTLLQNGLIVTKHGTLIDGHGMVSSLDNLKLRPIVMGQSISFDHFVRQTHSEINFKIQPNSPIMEGLLLTMIKPPKILGIVPLSRSSASHNFGPNHDNLGVYGVGSHKGAKRHLKVLPISHLVSFRKDWPKLKGFRTANQHSVIKIRSDESKKSDLTKQALKDDGTEGRHSGEPEGLSEEVPDFRIIGGMSATVSGTPLLNRGRSGHDYEYEDEDSSSPTEHFSNNYERSPTEKFSSSYGRALVADDDDEVTS